MVAGRVLVLRQSSMRSLSAWKPQSIAPGESPPTLPPTLPLLIRYRRVGDRPTRKLPQNGCNVRVGDNSPASLSIRASHPKSSIEDLLWQLRLQAHTSADGQIVRYSVGKRHSPSSRGTRGSAQRSRTYSRHDHICKSSRDRQEAGIGTSDSE